MERVHVVLTLDAPSVRLALAAIAEHVASGDIACLSEAIASARAFRLAWRRESMVEFSEARRSALIAALSSDPGIAARVEHAPPLVRAYCLAVAEYFAARLARLRELRAPQVVLAGTRDRLIGGIAALDAGTDLEDIVEPLATLMDETGAERPNLHAWAETILRCARCPRVEVLLEDLESSEDSTRDLELAPGFENTTLGMSPSALFWLPPGIVLPRPLTTGATVACGLGGGPPTFAFAGDEMDPRTGSLLRSRARALTADEALASFVWVPNDVEIGWEHLD